MLREWAVRPGCGQVHFGRREDSRGRDRSRESVDEWTSTATVPTEGWGTLPRWECGTYRNQKEGSADPGWGGAGCGREGWGGCKGCAQLWADGAAAVWPGEAWRGHRVGVQKMGIACVLCPGSLGAGAGHLLAFVPGSLQISTACEKGWMLTGCAPHPLPPGPPTHWGSLWWTTWCGEEPGIGAGGRASEEAVGGRHHLLSEPALRGAGSPGVPVTGLPRTVRVEGVRAWSCGPRPWGSFVRVSPSPFLCPP